MSILNRLKNIARTTGKSVVRDVARTVVQEVQKNSSQRTGRSAPSRKSRKNQPSPKPRRDQTQGQRRRSEPEFPGPNDRAVEYDVRRYGLPDFSYRPEKDGAPDPGEVVWTWVPYEEYDGRGKDRPVLILADLDEHVIFGQMTSKDHTRDYADEDRWGRSWIDLGSGAWDSKGRPSELRLDRLLIAHMDQVRREGSQLDRAIFDDVVRELTELHG